MKFTYEQYLRACSGVAGMTKDQFEVSMNMKVVDTPKREYAKPTTPRKFVEKRRAYTEAEKEERRQNRRDKNGSKPRTDFSKMTADEAKQHKLRLKRESAQRRREKAKNES